MLSLSTTCSKCRCLKSLGWLMNWAPVATLIGRRHHFSRAILSLQHNRIEHAGASILLGQIDIGVHTYSSMRVQGPALTEHLLAHATVPSPLNSHTIWNFTGVSPLVSITNRWSSTRPSIRLAVPLLST